MVGGVYINFFQFWRVAYSFLLVKFGRWKKLISIVILLTFLSVFLSCGSPSITVGAVGEDLYTYDIDIGIDPNVDSLVYDGQTYYTVNAKIDGLQGKLPEGFTYDNFEFSVFPEDILEITYLSQSNLVFKLTNSDSPTLTLTATSVSDGKQKSITLNLVKSGYGGMNPFDLTNVAFNTGDGQQQFALLEDNRDQFMQKSLTVEEGGGDSIGDLSIDEVTGLLTFTPQGVPGVATYKILFVSKNYVNFEKTFQVTVSGSDGSSGGEGYAEAPSSDMSLVVSGLATGVQVSWGAPTSAGLLDNGDSAVITNYQIYYKKEGSSSYVSYGNYGATASPVNVIVSPGSYVVKVVAYSSAGLTSEKISESVSVRQETLDSTPPSKPLNFGILSNSQTSILVRWMAPTNSGSDFNNDPASIVRYEFSLRQIWPVLDSEFTLYTNLSPQDITISSGLFHQVITGLSHSTKYSLRLRTHNSAGEYVDIIREFNIDNTDVLSQSQAEGPPRGAKISYDSGVQPGTNSLTVTWMPPADAGKNHDGTQATIAAYKITYSWSDDKGVWNEKLFGYYSGDYRTVKITGLLSGVHYSIRITSFNSAGIGSIAISSGPNNVPL